MNGARTMTEPATRTMTDRERRIMLDAARGRSAQETADELGLTLFAVQHTLRRVKRDLRARTIAQAVALTIALGYISREEVTGS